MSTPSVQNCWPPMAWRPPAMQIGFSSLRARVKALRTASIESGSSTRNTRVVLSCE